MRDDVPFVAGMVVSIVGFALLSLWGVFASWNADSIQKCRDKQEWCAEEMPRLYEALFPEKGE